MNRAYWYYRFKADVAWLDDFIANVEDGFENLIIAITQDPGVVTGMTVSQNALGVDFSVDVSSGWAYDVYGRRVYNSATVNVPFTDDYNGDPITCTGGGNERTVSVYAYYHITDSDPVVDGNGDTVYTVGTEDTEFRLYQGTIAALGTSTPAANPNDGSVLLADVLIFTGDSTIANADIDTSVKDVFAVQLANDQIKDSQIDWGTGTDQVSAVDMPIEDVGTYYGTDNVEAALQSVGAALASGSSDLSSHIADTSTHGISSEIVGKDETQTLTNKTLTTPTIGSFANANHSHQNSAGGGTLDAAAIGAGTLPTARGGTGTTSSTGTGANVLQNSPTFTGTAAFADATFSGSATYSTLQASTALNGISGAPVSAYSDTGSTLGAQLKGDGTVLGAPLGLGAYGLGLSLSGGVLTITKEDGSTLSDLNPGYVVLPSTTAGRHKVLRVNAPASFKDDANASSDITGAEFGSTAGVAWANDRPFYLYAVNKDDTDAGLLFAISPMPFFTKSPNAANSIGYKGNPPVTSTDDTMFFLTSSSPTATYQSKPCVCIGSFRMQKSTADDWTVQTLEANYEGIGRFNDKKVFDMPLGQMSSVADNLISTNGPTSSTLSAVGQYQIDREGVSIYIVQNTDTNGSGGSSGITLQLPLRDGSQMNTIGALNWHITYNNLPRVVENTDLTINNGRVNLPGYFSALTTVSQFVNNGWGTVGIIAVTGKIIYNQAT